MADAQIVFVVPPDHFRRGRPIAGSQHVRQVEPIARLMGAPILCQPEPGALNVITDGRPCWRWPAGARSAHIGHGVSDKGNYLASNADATLVPNAYIAARSGPPSRVIGAAHLDPLFDGTLAPAPSGSRPRVLYAPTISQLTNGHPMASSRGSLTQIATALGRFDLILSDHPHHSGAGVTPLQAYLDADVIVCDYGSTLHIAVALDKPAIIAPGSGIPEPGSLEEVLGAAVEHATLADLADRVALAAESGPMPSQSAWRDRVLAPEHRGRGAQVAADVIAGLA